jgi:phage shock protein PspC (stress-responsive transcriptional regulator)
LVNDRLYRSRDDRMLAGVAGGLAERFDLDPSLVRVLWVILVFVSGGLFLLAYVAMAIVVPEEPLDGVAWLAGAQGGSSPAAVGGAVSAAPSGPASGELAGWGVPAAAAGAASFSASMPPEAGGPGPGASGEPAAASDIGGAPDAGNAPADGGPAAAEAPLWPSTPPPSAPPATAPPPPAAPPPPPWTVSERHRRRERRGGGAIIGGIVLVLIGGYFLLRTMVPQLDLGAFWPVLLIVIGIALLVASVRPGRSPGA